MAIPEKIKIRITEDDLLQLDEDKWYEVVDGQLIEGVEIGGLTHVIVIDNLFWLLRPFVRQHHLGRVHTDSLTFILHVNADGVENTRIPDLSFIRRGRVPANFDKARGFPGAPDLAVEVVSPNNRPAELMRRVSDYLRFGSEQAWLLYAARKELHQYFADGTPPRIYKADDTLIAETLFPGLSIHIADLFIDEDDEA